MGNNQKKTYIIIGVIVLVFVLIFLAFILRRPSTQTSPTTSQKATAVGYVANNSNALPTVEGGTREKVTTNIPTPGVNAANLPSNVAIPINVTKTGSVSFRQFDIKGQGNKFVPSTIIVNAGDIIDLKIDAVDGNYSVDFPDFGISVSANQGQTGHAQFQAVNYGQYQFFCKVCNGNVTGTLIINQ